MLEISLAVLIGGAFGYTLDRIGATNPGYLIRMLNLTNLHLMKTILMGIGVASVLTFSGLLAGFVDAAHLSVKTAYVGVFIGGILLGLGWALSGYCPGTGVAAVATGRVDAVFFVLGGLIGAAAYMVTYVSVAATSIMAPVAGGKATMGVITKTKFPPLLTSVSGEWLGLILGLALIAVAFLLPNRIVGDRSKNFPAE
jgi:uncharacterized protein